MEFSFSLFFNIRDVCMSEQNSEKAVYFFKAIWQVIKMHFCLNTFFLMARSWEENLDV